jgi:hypothetical protein
MIVKSPRGSHPPADHDLKGLIEKWAGSRAVPSTIRTITDTTDFFRVDYGDVVVIGERPYLIRNNEREGRFGLDDEPKFWVKRAIDLFSGETKVMKLGFIERFEARAGDFVFDCVRSPGKEARILDLVRGHPHFMQGFWVRDEAGNRVRIIDFIRGPTLAQKVLDLGAGHEEYFFAHFPGVLRKYIELVESIAYLHRRGEKHGDIRRDHILVEGGDGPCRWIDFDFNFSHATNPYQYDLFGLGNILAYLAGRGDVTLHDLKRSGDGLCHRLDEKDMNIVFRNRVVNLRKAHPYIPESLNRVLMHFSAGSETYYETIDELLEDLGEVEAGLAALPTRCGTEP